MEYVLDSYGVCMASARNVDRMKYAGNRYVSELNRWPRDLKAWNWPRMPNECLTKTVRVGDVIFLADMAELGTV